MDLENVVGKKPSGDEPTLEENGLREKVTVDRLFGSSGLVMKLRDNLDWATAIARVEGMLGIPAETMDVFLDWCIHDARLSEIPTTPEDFEERAVGLMGEFCDDTQGLREQQ